MFLYKYKGARFTRYKILLMFMTQRTSARRNYITLRKWRIQEDLIAYIFRSRNRFFLYFILDRGTSARVLGHFLV